MRRRDVTGRFAEEDAARRLRANSEPQGDCTVYTAGKPRRSGHRAMRYHGKTVGVHRIAWTITFGEIPAGLCVLHRCDVPSCIQPAHLFLGTVLDNNADRDRKGRHARVHGSRHSQAKLSEHQVLAIRASGETQKALAARYGVTAAAISSIRTRKTWRHIPEAA